LEEWDRYTKEVLPGFVVEKFTDFLRFKRKMSDRIKYSQSLPLERYQQRDVRVPAEAAWTAYMIDFEHGSDHELCLTIMTHVFRELEKVSKTLNGDRERLSKTTTEPEWHFVASCTRNMRRKVISHELESLKTIEEGIHSKTKEKKSKVLDTPVARKLFTVGNEHRLSPHLLEPTISQHRETLMQELSYYEADVNNLRFTQEEEIAARAKAGPPKNGMGKEWKDTLKSLLTEILQEHDNELAIEKTCSYFLEIERDHTKQTEMEFAKQIEKILQFTEWMCKILLDPTEILKATRRYQYVGFNTFKKGLRPQERIQWTYVKASGLNPLQEVLDRLREQQNSKKPETEPVLVIKKTKKQEPELLGLKRTESKFSEQVETLGPRRKQEREEDDEEEGEVEEPQEKKKKPTPPSKPLPPAKPAAVAEIESVLTVMNEKITQFEQLLNQRQNNNNNYNGNNNSSGNFNNRNENSNYNNRNENSNYNNGYYNNNNNYNNNSQRNNGRNNNDNHQNFQRRGSRNNNRERRREDFRNERNSNFTPMGRTRECRYQPCSNPSCRFLHTTGTRKLRFIQQSRCMEQHDTSGCKFTRCRYTHGRGTEKAEKCDSVLNGMCEDFYTEKGCIKSHT